MTERRTVQRRTVLVAATGVAAGTALSACTAAGAAPTWNSPGSSPAGSSSASAEAAADLKITPADAAKNVSPADGVLVTAVSGTLQSVTVTAGAATVAGEMDADQKTWRSSGRLGYGKTYKVTASVATSSGAQPLTRTVTFSTVTPAKTVAVTFQSSAMAALKNGGTYGVGQPAIVHFSKAPSNKAAAVKALDLTVEPPVEVRWRWIDAQTVHGRPETYWATGTKITINANVYGVNLGKGVYGKANASATYTIGPSRIAIADSRTHMMQVFLNGKVIRNIPVSMGKGGTTTGGSGETIDFWTRSGAHMVVSKELTHRMTSASYGITNPSDPNFYDETIQLCCRISYSGEFVHSAPWSVSAQGHRNVSHGCINISPSNARWFYDTFQIGDMVVVKNTPKTLPVWDGVADWTIAWNKW
jgi:lipoprotein-anchoring transpeptidase ErfK/SrfK